MWTSYRGRLASILSMRRSAERVTVPSVTVGKQLLSTVTRDDFPKLTTMNNGDKVSSRNRRRYAEQWSKGTILNLLARYANALKDDFKHKTIFFLYVVDVL